MSYQELPVQMHPRYKEFLAFMTECPHRKTPETMQTAFWAWLNKSGNQSIIVVEQAKEITALKNDLDRLHRERDSFQQQARELAEEVDRLQSDLKRARDALASVLIGLGGQAFGERGHACMSIDGGNL